MTKCENSSKASTKKAARSSLADEIGRRVFDDKAETIKELIAATGYGDKQIREMVAERVESGAWEQVWKRGARMAVPAYRRAR